MTGPNLAHLNDLREQLSDDDRQRFAAWLQALYRRTVGTDHGDPKAHGVDFAIAVLEDDANWFTREKSE